MKIVSYAQTLHDLNLFKDQGLSEVILGHKKFSRFGKLSTEEFIEFSTRARELKLKVIFEWDILMTEELFVTLTHEALGFVKYVDSFRLQDAGALMWAFKHTDRPLQFIAENGNHNLIGLKAWVDSVRPRMERIVISIELPKDKIAEYVKALTVPCELLGFGRILLFYTPRGLLSPLVDDKLAVNQELAAVGESEESPHKGFPIVENRHGTFMFHIKEFSLIDYVQELKDLGLQYFRVDLRWENPTFFSRIFSLIQEPSLEKFEVFKEAYPQDLMRGFYLVNKTDILFPKLKNHRLQKREGDYVGEVIESEKGSHLAIMIKNAKGLKRTDKLKFVHPEGKIFEVDVFSLKNLALEEVSEIPSSSVALVQFVGGVWVKSHVFYQ